MRVFLGQARPKCVSLAHLGGCILVGLVRWRVALSGPARRKGCCVQCGVCCTRRSWPLPFSWRRAKGDSHWRNSAACLTEAGVGEKTRVASARVSGASIGRRGASQSSAVTCPLARTPRSWRVFTSALNRKVMICEAHPRLSGFSGFFAAANV